MPASGVKVPKESPFPFYLKTSQRAYIFAAKADQARSMWLSAFRYVIASTSAIQSILHHKTGRIDEKIK